MSLFIMPHVIDLQPKTVLKSSDRTRRELEAPPKQMRWHSSSWCRSRFGKPRRPTSAVRSPLRTVSICAGLAGGSFQETQGEAQPMQVLSDCSGKRTPNL